MGFAFPMAFFVLKNTEIKVVYRDCSGHVCASFYDKGENVNDCLQYK